VTIEVILWQYLTKESAPMSYNLSKGRVNSILKCQRVFPLRYPYPNLTGLFSGWGLQKRISQG
jgi:hypothetical protein